MTATPSPSPVNESASFDQVFTITLANDQLTAASTTGSIGTAVTLGGDLSGLTKGTVVKSSLSEFTIQLTGNLAYSTGSGTITLNASELEDAENAVATVTVTAPTGTSISSTADQAFTVGDLATAADTITITDNDGGTIRKPAAAEIRIRIPTAFNMTWDTTVTSITKGGGCVSQDRDPVEDL